MINYFTNKEKEKCPIKVEKEVELTKIKVDLMFIGKNNEVEIYTEFATGEHEKQDKDTILTNLMQESSAKRYFLLPFHGKCISTDYYTLAKATIINTDKIKKKVLCYEFKEITS